MTEPRRRGGPPGSARDIALDVLTAVSRDDAYANLELSRMLRHRRPDPREAALATELTFGTLRLRGRYDAVLAACSARPLEQIDPVVLDALRLGAHQLLTLATPSYAAVSATVDQIRQRAGQGAAKFGNAVLRAVGRRSWPEWFGELASPDADPVERWTVEWSHPAWIIRALRDALAKQDAVEELEALLVRNDEAGPVSLVARPGRIGRPALLEQTEGRPGDWSPWAVRVSGDPARFPAVRSGAAGVQDEGSQLMALAMSRLPAASGDWLDLCAGPGGKAATLAGLALEAGAQFEAVEQHPHRAELVRTATADGPPVTVHTGDALITPLGEYGRILLDAPCTGLGAIRRRPELRWRRQPADLPQLRALQGRLLDRAVELLLPGGCVAYVTCSPHPAETHDIVSAALRRHPGLRAVPAAPLLPEVPDAAVGDFVQLWPQRHDTDGMFLAVLQVPR